MAAYGWVYGFGHQRADCRGPGSARNSTPVVKVRGGIVWGGGLSPLLPFEPLQWYEPPD